MRYAILNLDVIDAAIRIAKQEGLNVSLDLASFEVEFEVFIEIVLSSFVAGVSF